MPSINMPLLSIPLYYALATYPHGHAMFIASKGQPKALDNRNPKSTALIDSFKKRLGPKDFATFERAESCHRNHLENMPLFVAAVFAGLLAERETGQSVGTDTFVVMLLGVRVLYTVNYLVTDTQGWSYLRSLLYFVATGLCFATIGRAALALA